MTLESVTNDTTDIQYLLSIPSVHLAEISIWTFMIVNQNNIPMVISTSARRGELAANALLPFLLKKIHGLLKDRIGKCRSIANIEVV